MTNYIFKINGTTQDLGVIKQVIIKRIINKIIVPAFTTGDSQEILNFGKTVRQFEITGRYIETEANINTFITNINKAEYNSDTVTGDPIPCTLALRTDIGTSITCIVYGFDFTDNGGIPGYIDYNLILVEGIPASTG